MDATTAALTMLVEHPRVMSMSIRRYLDPQPHRKPRPTILLTVRLIGMVELKQYHARSIDEALNKALRDLQPAEATR